MTAVLLLDNLPDETQLEKRCYVCKRVFKWASAWCACDFINLTYSYLCLSHQAQVLLSLTLMVSSMDRNFLLSPISMALLISGTASFTASSIGTGGMFSPPAVMISSEINYKDTHRLTNW